MIEKQLGSSGLSITALGLGTWAMGGSGWSYGWGDQDDAESVKTIHRALAAGINWIDTAPAYGLGHAEILVGKAVKGMHDKPLIFTKCGLTWKSNRKIKPRLTKTSILQEIDESLRRLSVDAIDLYQIHWPVPEHSLIEAWETVDSLIDKGKIRFAGVCNFSPEQLKKISTIRMPVSVQAPYSVVDRAVEDSLIGFCSKSGIGLLAYSPLQKGLLTNTFDYARVSGLPESDHRKWDVFFQEPLLTKAFRVAKALEEMAESKGMTAAQLAIAWLAAHNTVASVIVGRAHPETDCRDIAFCRIFFDR